MKSFKLSKLIFCFLALFLSVGTVAHANPLQLSTAIAVATDTGLSIKGEVTDADYQRVAEGMFKVREALSNKYTLADQLTLGLYVLRYLSDLGQYEVNREDIAQLLKGLEDLSGSPFDPEFKALLVQIEKLRFGERQNQKYVKIFTKNPEGIRVPLDTMNAGSNGGNKVLFMMIKNKSQLFFRDLDGTKDDNFLADFIKKKIKLLFFTIKSLNQIHPSLPKNISTYIKGGRPVPSLLIEFDGIYARVATSTLFKNVDFYLQKAVALPGIVEGEEGLPSLVLEARGKLLRAKISIDR